MEFAQRLVVDRHGALPLQHVDFNRRLAVGRGREDFGLLGRDGRVRRDHRRGNAPHRLDAQRKRRHVQQKNVLHVAGKDAPLDCGTDGHHFVRIHASVRFLAEEILHQLLDLGDTGGTTHQNHLINIVRRHVRLAQSLLARSQRLLEQIFGKLFELGAGNGQVQVLRAFLRRRDEGKVHIGLHLVRKLHLGLLCGLAQALQRHCIAPQIDSFLLLELVGDKIHQTLVEVVPAKVRIAACGLHFEHAVAKLKNGDIERAAAKVVDGNFLIRPFLVQTVCQSGRGRLVDDALHFQPGNLAGVLGCLALRVVEIGRNGDHRLGNLLSQIVFGRLLHLLQDHGGNFRRRIEPVVDLHPYRIVIAAHHLVRHHLLLLLHLVMGTPHKALDRINGVLRVGYGLTLGGLTDKTIARLGEEHTSEPDNGGGSARPFAVGNDGRRRPLHNGHYRVGGAEINADNFPHSRYLCVLKSIIQIQCPIAASSVPSRFSRSHGSDPLFLNRR